MPRVTVADKIAAALKKSMADRADVYPAADLYFVVKPIRGTVFRYRGFYICLKEYELVPELIYLEADFTPFKVLRVGFTIGRKKVYITVDLDGTAFRVVGERVEKNEDYFDPFLGQ